MLIYWLPLGVGVIAIGVVVAVFMRHWQEIALLKPESIKEEREKRKRDELITQRFDRLKSEKVAPVKAVVNKAVFAGKTKFHAAYLKLLRLEKYYKQAKAPFAAMSPSAKERIKILLDDARSLGRDLKWADAERRYLEALALDNRSWDAYKGLGGIYLKQKLYPQAKETFEFLLRSKKADDTCYAALAEIAQHEGDDLRAEDMRKKAVDFRPRLANRQAEMAQFYLDREKPEKAWPFIKKATELDQKSAKYLELSLEAAILLRDRNEARRRYDKLRLLSEDRPKLQAMKDKIEAIG